MTNNNHYESINKLSKIIRIATIPPILVSVLTLLIYSFTDNVFTSSAEAFGVAFFLGIFPVLAYPFQLLIPILKAGGRALQRKLAFVFTIIGYSIGMAWAIFSNVSSDVFLLMFSYFFAAVILACINVFTKIKASGHICSATGVLIYTFYFFGVKATIPVIVISTSIIWSSLALKRHTPSELATGAFPSLLSFLIGYIIF